MEDSKLNLDKKTTYKQIKSKFILRKIFDFLPQYNLLKIILHNKDIKNKLNKDIDDYKNYLRTEILVIPKSKVQVQYFNIYEKDSLPYIHVYLNDDKNETKGPYFTKDNTTKKIKILIDYEFNNFYGLFQNCYYIYKINFI